jgi:hypothetical protein
MPYRLLSKLLEAESAVNFKALAKDAPHVLERCEVTMLLFKKYKGQIQELAPSLEQLKGLVKGFELATEIAGQHKKILQEACKKQEMSKEEFLDKAQLVDAVCQSLKEGAENRKEELLKAAGRIEGMFTSAMGALEQIRGFLQNLETQRAFMEANPDMFGKEAEGEGDGGNGKSEMQVVVPPTEEKRPTATEAPKRRKKAKGQRAGGTDN